MFVVFNTAGQLESAFPFEPLAYINDPDHVVAQTEEGVAFDPRFPYTLVDGVAVRGATMIDNSAEEARLKAEFDALQYQRDRAKAYPSIVDQLDVLYHGGYDAWRAAVQEVKDQFPKP
jgi:hypothetical protein